MKAYETTSVDEPFAETRVRLVIVVWGDPVIARALVLLLRGSGYDARHLSDSSLSETKVLESVQILLLTPIPEPSSKQREALLTSLRNTPGATKIPVIELVPLRTTPRATKIPVIELVSEETTEGRAQYRPWYTVLWPCRIQELERQIEAALHGNLGAESAASQEPGTQTERKESSA